MATYKYSFQEYNNEVMARASGANLSISLKKSVEICKALQGKRVTTAIDYLEKVIDQKAVVPYTRYKQETPHRRGSGIDTGGYPVNVAKEMLVLVKSAFSNAKEKELGENLYILSASCRKGTSRYHYGRYSGRKMKSTNVEVILAVKEKKATAKPTKATAEVAKK